MLRVHFPHHGTTAAYPIHMFSNERKWAEVTPTCTGATIPLLKRIVFPFLFLLPWDTQAPDAVIFNCLSSTSMTQQKLATAGPFKTWGPMYRPWLHWPSTDPDSNAQHPHVSFFPLSSAQDFRILPSFSPTALLWGYLG